MITPLPVWRSFSHMIAPLSVWRSFSHMITPSPVSRLFSHMITPLPVWGLFFHMITPLPVWRLFSHMITPLPVWRLFSQWMAPVTAGPERSPQVEAPHAPCCFPVGQSKNKITISLFISKKLSHHSNTSSSTVTRAQRVCGF